MATLTVMRSRRRRSLPLALFLLVLLCLGSTRLSAAAPSAVAGPTLDSVVTSSNLPGLVTVSGHGFTPGARVYVALYDRWGRVLYETRWTMASGRYFQPPLNLGSGDDLHFDTGGAIAEAFVLAPALQELAAISHKTGARMECPAAVMARAYDQSTARWSAVVDLACTD